MTWVLPEFLEGSKGNSQTGQELGVEKTLLSPETHISYEMLMR